MTTIQGQKLNPGQVDFSGVETFWMIHQLLVQDREPNEDQWESLFSKPCYQHIGKGQARERIQQRFRLAYMPSNKHQLTKLLSKNDYSSRLLHHLVDVSNKREQIQTYIDSLKRVNILENALLLTAKYLPKDFIEQNKDAYPPIAFGIFEPDGQANNQQISIDIAFAQTINFNGFLAHEAHHFFVSKIRHKMKKAEGGVEKILLSIRQLHFEGSADLIDKKHLVNLPKDLKESEDWYAYHYNKYYNNARNTFSNIDSLLSKCSDGIAIDKNGKKMWKALHFGTHPEAMHMAILIEETYGTQKIIDLLNNPFDFFKAYRKAAKKQPEKGWIFSKKSMKYLSKLEKEYLKT